MSNAPKPVGLYPLTRRVGDLLFLSGVDRASPEAGRTTKGCLVRAGPQRQLHRVRFRSSARGVLANVKAILEAEGANWEDLVDITVFLTDMQRDFGTWNRVYREHFEHVDPARRPCRTTMEIGALPTPIAVELKCIAHLGQD